MTGPGCDDVGSNDVLVALRANPVLAQAHVDDLAKLSAHCRLVHYRPGRCFIHEGENADTIYCLARGGARVFYRPGGEALVVKLFGPPALLGEADVLLHKGWSQSVETVLPSDLVHIPRRAFEALIDRSHGLCKALAYDLATRLLVATNHARMLAFGGAQARIARHLLDYLKLFGEERSDGLGHTITVSITQEDIGKSLAISRQTVQSVLAELKHDEILAKRDGRYVVRDPEALARRAYAAGSVIGQDRHW